MRVVRRTEREVEEHRALFLAACPGWAVPFYGGRRAHYFSKAGVSLCGRWNALQTWNLPRENAPWHYKKCKDCARRAQ